MLAFCFLTYDEIEREDIWTLYFKNVARDKYSIHCHPKLANKINRQNLFKDTIIDKHVDTAWGSFSLIEAQKLLIDDALKNEQTTHIVIVSHNTIPIQSFDKLYEFLLNKGSVFNYFLDEQRYSTFKNPAFNRNKCYKQQQWCILSKIDAHKLTNNHEEIKDIFGKSHIPDEHAYINFLIHYEYATTNLTNLTNIGLIYLEWGNMHPNIITNITSMQLIDYRKKNMFFLRKVNSRTRCDINLLFMDNIPDEKIEPFVYCEKPIDPKEIIIPTPDEVERSHSQVSSDRTTDERLKAVYDGRIIFLSKEKEKEGVTNIPPSISINGSKPKIALILRGHVRQTFTTSTLYDFIRNLCNTYDIDIYIHTWKTLQTGISWRYIKIDRSEITMRHINNYFNNLSVNIKYAIIEDEENIKLIGSTNGYISSSLMPKRGWKNMWYGKYQIIDYIKKNVNINYDCVINSRFDLFTYSAQSEGDNQSISNNIYEELITFRINEYLHRNIIVVKPTDVDDGGMRLSIESAEEVTDISIPKNAFLYDNEIIGLDNIYFGNIDSIYYLIKHFHTNMDTINDIYKLCRHQEYLVFYENNILFDHIWTNPEPDATDECNILKVICS